VLVVDDNEMNRDLLSRRVKRLGHTVAVAEHGIEALERLNAGPFDLVLLDITMPEMDGFEVLERLKADPALAHIPVIMISAIDQTKAIARCIELGADDFLPKPFDSLLLRARMSSSLAKKRLHDRERLYAESLERELEIGRRIQSSFLPDTLPAPPGYELAARFRAARQVSGDFYDAFIPRERTETVLAVGDVCDKGVGAALFMAVIRSLVRALLDEGASLERLAELLNHYIADTHGKSHMFATLFLGVLEPGSGSLGYLNAGHEPPVLLSADGTIGRLPVTGPAIGLLPGLEFGTGTAQLEPGATLLVHTDGVTEGRNEAGAFYGEERLLVRVGASATLAPDAFLGAILGDVDVFSKGMDQADDITMLAVRRLG
jgi:serine phosphatase RsbU (regulator of sigma subunit)